MTALSDMASCRRCGERKPASEFWPNPKISTGLSSWCKDCQREASRASRERYRDRYNAKRRKDPLPPRGCPVCGNEFVPATANSRYCPPTDDDRRRAGPNTQPRSQCAKRADNSRQRHGELTTVAELPLPAPFVCRCGKRCVPGENVGRKAKVHCSQRCKREAFRERQEAA